MGFGNVCMTLLKVKGIKRRDHCVDHVVKTSSL